MCTHDRCRGEDRWWDEDDEVADEAQPQPLLCVAAAIVIVTSRNKQNPLTFYIQIRVQPEMNISLQFQW